MSKGKLGLLDIRVRRGEDQRGSSMWRPFAVAAGEGEVVATDPGSCLLTGDSGEEALPRLVLGVGDGRGFRGQVSPAKLALADALDGVVDRFELRIHGVGGSSPEQMLEQVETVQVAGDDTAQFLRRVPVARQPTVRWPLEGYWWGRADLARPGQGVLGVLDLVDVVQPGQLDAPCACWPASAAAPVGAKAAATRDATGGYAYEHF